MSRGFWIRALARLPLSMLYAAASLAAFVLCHVVRYRRAVVLDNLTRVYPDLDPGAIRRIARRHYANLTQLVVELIKASRLPPSELRRRVDVQDLGEVRDRLGEGRSVLLLAAHQSNWEWALLALSLQLGFPLAAAYKPLRSAWAEHEVHRIRSRFGCRLLPAKQVFAEAVANRGSVRALAMVADQEPVTADLRHWTRFLGRDTAFYKGPEELVRALHLATYFLGLRRVARGRYALSLQKLADTGEALADGELTERYAAAVERQVHAAPAEWMWTHRRWRLKRSLYQRRAPSRAGGAEAPAAERSAAS